MKERIWISFPKPFGGFIELWWFPTDNLNLERQGRGYWQIGGHIFTNNNFLQTGWSLGRYCGKVSTNLFVRVDLNKKTANSLFLFILLHKRLNR